MRSSGAGLNLGPLSAKSRRGSDRSSAIRCRCRSGAAATGRAHQPVAEPQTPGARVAAGAEGHGPAPVEGGTPGGVRMGRLTDRAPGGPRVKGPGYAQHRRLTDAEREERRERDRQRLHRPTEQLLESEGWKRWVRSVPATGCCPIRRLSGSAASSVPGCAAFVVRDMSPTTQLTQDALEAWVVAPKAAGLVSWPVRRRSRCLGRAWRAPSRVTRAGGRSSGWAAFWD